MTRIYVGNLPMDVRERDLDDFFYRYGRIVDIEVKRPQRPPAFAFVSFTDPRDARDAVHYRDGASFDGGRLRVELQQGSRGKGSGHGGGGGGGSRFGGDRYDYHHGGGGAYHLWSSGGRPPSPPRWHQDNEDRRKKRPRDGSAAGSYRGGGGGGGGGKKRDDSDGSNHDDTVGHYTGGKGDVIADTYEVCQEVGVGTFGRVLECIDLKGRGAQEEEEEDIDGGAGAGASADDANGDSKAVTPPTTMSTTNSSGAVASGVCGVGNKGSSQKQRQQQQQRRVAIKVVRSIGRYTESAAIEAGILQDVDKRQRARGTDLCVQLLAHFQFQGHFCLVFESLGRSLYDYLKKNEYRPFPFPMVVSFTKQMLEAVDFLHTMDLCHTDLKPENVLAVTTAGEHYVESGYPGDNSKVLVPASTKIKVIDFGGATYDNDDHKSSVVNTRQYRAPEVILGLGWSMPSDCWSVGCIAAELYQGELLFATHGNTEHLALMEKRVGPFPAHVVAKSKERKKYFSLNSSSSSSSSSSSPSSSSTPRVRVDSLTRDSERFVRKCSPLAEMVRPEHKDCGGKASVHGGGGVGSGGGNGGGDSGWGNSGGAGGGEGAREGNNEKKTKHDKGQPSDRVIDKIDPPEKGNGVADNDSSSGSGAASGGATAVGGGGGRGWLELLQGLLTLDPAERASAYDALQWRWNQAPSTATTTTTVTTPAAAAAAAAAVAAVPSASGNGNSRRSRDNTSSSNSQSKRHTKAGKHSE